MSAPGATAIVDAGEAGATELAKGHPGQRVPGAKGTQGLLQDMRLQQRGGAPGNPTGGGPDLLTHVSGDSSSDTSPRMARARAAGR